MELLRDLSRCLTDLAEVPVSEHPQALDDVHQEIVAELEAISRLGAGHRGLAQPGAAGQTAAPPALDRG